MFGRISLKHVHKDQNTLLKVEKDFSLKQAESLLMVLKTFGTYQEHSVRHLEKLARLTGQVKQALKA